jgi:hypothetical protein
VKAGQRIDVQTGELIDVSESTVKTEAKPNGWVSLWLTAHRLGVEMEKLYIAAGFEERRLKLEEVQLEHLEVAINGIVSDIGADPADPEIRKKIHARLAAVS